MPTAPRDEICSDIQCSTEQYMCPRKSCTSVSRLCMELVCANVVSGCIVLVSMYHQLFLAWYRDLPHSQSELHSKRCALSTRARRTDHNKTNRGVCVCGCGCGWVGVFMRACVCVHVGMWLVGECECSVLCEPLRAYYRDFRLLALRVVCRDSYEVFVCPSLYPG